MNKNEEFKQKNNLSEMVKFDLIPVSYMVGLGYAEADVQGWTWSINEGHMDLKSI